MSIEFQSMKSIENATVEEVTIVKIVSAPGIWPRFPDECHEFLTDDVAAPGDVCFLVELKQDYDGYVAYYYIVTDGSWFRTVHGLLESYEAPKVEANNSHYVANVALNLAKRDKDRILKQIKEKLKDGDTTKL